jgi:hypothetical protein
LFLTRAVAVRRDFTANGEVAQICERLDNLPLAIELAAARVRLLSPRALLERLEQRLPRLSGGPKTHPIGTVDTTNRLHAITAMAATRTAGIVRPITTRQRTAITSSMSPRATRVGSWDATSVRLGDTGPTSMASNRPEPTQPRTMKPATASADIGSRRLSSQRPRWGVSERPTPFDHGGVPPGVTVVV